MAERSKRLHRVIAKNDAGHVLYRRDYQSEKAAKDRAIRLLDQGLVWYDGEDHSAYWTPVAAVTIQTSDIVIWPSEPVPYKRWGDAR